MQNADKDNEDRRSITKEEKEKRLIGQRLEVLGDEWDFSLQAHTKQQTRKSLKFILIWREGLICRPPLGM
jgi:hypothetical protein